MKSCRYIKPHANTRRKIRRLSRAIKRGEEKIRFTQAEIDILNMFIEEKPVTIADARQKLNLGYKLAFSVFMDLQRKKLIKIF